MKVEMKPITRRIKNFSVGDPSGQAIVEVYPKKGKHDRSDIDFIRLKLLGFDENNGDNSERILDMTPDEAMMLSGLFSNAISFWLINYKPYYDTVGKRVRGLTKKYMRFVTKKLKTRKII